MFNSHHIYSSAKHANRPWASPLESINGVLEGTEAANSEQLTELGLLPIIIHSE